MIDIVKLIPNAYFGVQEDNPTIDEISAHVRHAIRHSMRVHFYLNEIGLEINDGELPHDLTGIGNKLEWEVIRGFAFREKDTEEKERIFQESLKRHRMQRHNRMWNSQNEDATEKDLRYGAIDSIVYLLENRGYQGGCHTIGKIEEKILCNPKYKQKWMYLALDDICRINAKISGPPIEYLQEIIKK